MLKLEMLDIDLNEQDRYFKYLLDYSGKARREGLLSLEEDLHLSPLFIREMVQLAIDGTEPDLILNLGESLSQSLVRILETQLNLISDAAQLADKNLSPTLKEICLESHLPHSPESVDQMFREMISSLCEWSTCDEKLNLNLMAKGFLSYAKKLQKSSSDEWIQRRFFAKKCRSILVSFQHFLETVLKGVLAIQAGDNPRIVELKLRSGGSPGKRETYYKYSKAAISKDSFLSKEEIDQLLRGDFGLEDFESTQEGEDCSQFEFMSKKFEEVINSFDDRAIQRIIKEADSRDLTRALARGPKSILDKFLVNLSPSAAKMLREDIECLSPCGKRCVAESQSMIIKIIETLTERGHIIGVES